MMMAPKGGGSKNVILSYDDDDTKGNMGTRDVKLDYNFGYFSLKSYNG